MADTDIVVGPGGTPPHKAAWTVEQVQQVLSMVVNGVNFIERFTPLNDQAKNVIAMVETVVQSPWFVQAVVSLESLLVTGTLTKDQAAAEFLKIVLAQAK